MFRNYLKVAWRHIWRQKVYSTINILGLSIGMAACIIILLFVTYEKSFDSIHHKNLYRLDEVQQFEGMLAAQKVALSMFPMGPTLKTDFPEILNFTRINTWGRQQFGYGDKKQYLSKLLLVDSTFLSMFDFPLLEGSRGTALQKPHSLVLTASSAKKLFGSEDALGKTLTNYGGDTITYTVTGVLADIPPTNHLQFDALGSFNTIYKPNFMTFWGGNWLNTYLELAPGTDPRALERKFPAYLKKYMPDGGYKGYTLFLQPLRDIHAGSQEIGLDNNNFQEFDRTYTNIFMAIALIVLAIACINFMNLSTARSSERAREVGIRKTVGSTRSQLGLQFIGESVLLAFLSLGIAILLVEAFLPYVHSLSQRDLGLFQHPIFLVYLFFGTLVLGVLSGLYPSLYLSGFKPVNVLKGSPPGKGLLRNILVVTQFTCAVFLIVATLLAVRQLNFMRDRDPGFNKDAVVTLPLDQLTYKYYWRLKDELLQSSLVQGVTASQDQLGSHLDQSGVEFRGDSALTNLTSTRLIVDPDYLTLYHIPLVEGHNFSKDSVHNAREYIINQTLARELLKNSHAPLSSLVGRHFGFDSAGYIAGIARDFNFNSLHYKIETMFFFAGRDQGYSTVSVKINGARTADALRFIQTTWQRLFPQSPLEYHFLDEHFEDVYRADTQVSRIVGILAVLAILIACLGLFGLATYAAERRIKEVGIRKVLGASVSGLVALLSRDFLVLVLIADAIALPLSIYTTHRWLEGFAYRVENNWWVFVLSGILSLLIALCTVSFRAWNAAMANPVNSLRTE
jgi:putative ABC transport system permease protein